VDSASLTGVTSFFCDVAPLKAAAEVAKANQFKQIHIASLVNLCNNYESGVKALDYTKAAASRRALAAALGTMGRSVPDTCAICLCDLDAAEPTTTAESRIVVPECMHMLHMQCFEQCTQARCPTCMQGVTMFGIGEPAETADADAVGDVPLPSPLPLQSAPPQHDDVTLAGHEVFGLE
jgi:hypothetical protein